MGLYRKHRFRANGCSDVPSSRLPMRQHSCRLNTNPLYATLLALSLTLSLGDSCLATSIVDRPNIVFRNMGVDQGLSNSQIHHVHQDPTGMIWIGTGEGLNSYDGKSFKIYDKQNSKLSNDSIRAIESTGDNGLWIATDDGLYLWPANSRELRRFHLAGTGWLARKIHALLVDLQGNLWVAHDRGVSIISAENHDVSHAMTGIHTRSLGKDDHHVWAGTNRGNVYRFRSAQDTTPANMTLPNGSPIRALVNVEQDHMWVGTHDAGVFVLNRQSLKIVDRHQMGDSSQLRSNEIRSILKTSNNTICVGTGRGLAIYSSKSRTYQTYLSSSLSDQTLSHDIVVDLFEDSAGLVWIATYIGVSVFKDTTNYLTRINQSNEPGLPNNNITSFAVAPKSEDFWIGTLGGVARWDSEKRVIGNRLLLSKRISSLKFDLSSNLWIGTFESGITVLKPDHSTATFTSSNNSGLPGNGITSIETDYTGRVWVGVFNKGVFYFDGKKFQTVSTLLHDSLPIIAGKAKKEAETPTIPVLKSDGHYLWISSLAVGLSRLNIESFSLSSYIRPKYRIVSLSPAPNDRLWLGTLNQGLHLYNKKTNSLEDHFTTADGLSSNGIYGILEVDERNVWISSGRGLNQLDPATRTVWHYGREKGAQHNDFNTNAYAKTPDGIMLFGGANGFNAFVSYGLPTPAKGPPIALRSITGEGEVQFDLRASPAYSPLELKHNINDIGFDLAVLDYTNPSNNAYKYRLRGYDSSWQSSRYNYVSYTNLDPGDYIFEFRGSAGDGIWSENTIQAPFTILNPPWLTWWAYLLYATFAALALWFIRINITNRMKLANVHHLEHLVEQRTREQTALLAEKELLLKEIHHRVKNNMQLISSLLTIQSQSIDDASIKSMFRMCQGRIQAMALIHESLYKSDDLRTINVEEYLKALALNLSSFQQAPDVSTPEITVSVDPIVMSIDTAIVCGLIVNELVTNSLKHAFNKNQSNSAINIYLATEENNYCLRVADNGIGVSDTTAFENPASMGISIISVLALRQLEGKMVLDNDSGTSVEIVFPIDQ